jgi:hypothetical protein
MVCAVVCLTDLLFLFLFLLCGGAEAEEAQDHRAGGRGSLASQEVPPACATP